MKSLLAICFTLYSFSVFSWDGVKASNNDSIEIEQGTLVRSGEDIEIYNNTSGGYENVSVDSINSSGFGTDIDITDSDGNSDTLEMD